MRARLDITQSKLSQISVSHHVSICIGLHFPELENTALMVTNPTDSLTVTKNNLGTDL